MAHSRVHEQARAMAVLALEKKAQDVRILDLTDSTTVTDFFVICHGESENQVKAICDHIDETMRKQGMRYWHREGYERSNWVLLDYVDVVVHIFLPEARTFYGLERLWGDAKFENLSDEDV